MKNIIYGLHSSLAAVQQRSFYIKEVCLLKSRNDARIQQIQSEISDKGVAFRFVDKHEIESICGDVNHQGVVVICKEQQVTNEIGLLEHCAQADSPLLILVLDQIVDPHNLGACIRTAEAAGASAVICSERKSASLTPTVHKVSCGASERMPVVVTKNLVRYLKELKQLGVWVYGTHASAEKLIYEADFSRSAALVIGAEGDGMRRLTVETCDELFGMPMSGEMASLNASVATGIGLYEAVRQRIQDVRMPD